MESGHPGRVWESIRASLRPSRWWAVGAVVGVLAGAASRLPGEAFGAAAFGAVWLVVIVVCVMAAERGPARPWVLGIILGGFGLRVTAGALVQALWLLQDVDAIRYEEFGRALAEHWRFGDPLTGLHPDSLRYIEQLPGYFVVNGIVYTLVGPNQMAMRVLNAAFGALTALVFGRIARDAFGVRAGLLTSLLIAIMPSFVIWSSLNLKDPAINLLVALALLGFQRFQRAPGWRAAAVVAALLALVYTLRPQMTLLLLGVFPLLYLIGSRWSRQALAVAALAVLAGGVALAAAGAPQLLGPWLNLDRLAEQRHLLANDGGSGYLGDVRFETPLDLLMFYPAVLAYFLFAPFPWAARGFTQLAAAPDMLAWYALLPFVGVGLWRARRQPLAWGVAGFALAYMLISAPIHANIGTLHRQRILFCGACFVLAAGGLPRRLTDRLPLPAEPGAAGPVPDRPSSVPAATAIPAGGAPS